MKEKGFVFEHKSKEEKREMGEMRFGQHLVYQKEKCIKCQNEVLVSSGKMRERKQYFWFNEMKAKTKAKFAQNVQ